MIRKQENTSHSDTSFVLAFICYQLSLLLIPSSCLVHSHIHTLCTSSRRRPVLRVTFKSNISNLIKKKRYWSYSIIILFASINWIVTAINLLFYLNQPFFTFIKYFEHFSWLFFTNVWHKGNLKCKKITNLLYTTLLSQNKRLICQLKRHSKVPENLRKKSLLFFDVINSLKFKNLF